MGFLKEHYAKVILCLVGVVLLIFESVVQNNKDFDVFIGASRLVAEGKTCYEVWLKSGTSGLKYFYSPLFAVLLFPLNNLPQVAYNLVWTGLSMLVIYRSFTVLSFFLPVNKLSVASRRLFYILAVASVARTIVDNLALGQMTFILVWGAMEAMRLIFIKKEIAGSALLALIINIKIIPIGLLAYLVYKKKLNAAFFTVLFCVLYLYLPAVFIGYEFNRQLLHDWLSSLTGTEAKSIYNDIGRSSLSSLIPSFLLDTPVQFSIKRNFLNLNEQQVNLVLNVARVLLLAFVAFLSGRPFRGFQNRKNLLYDVALVCIATPLVFPHQGKYAYFYMLPAYAYVIYKLIKLRALKHRPAYKNTYRLALFFITLSFVLITLTTDGVIGRKLSDAAEYLHLMVYGALCLLTGMAVFRPGIRQSH